MNAILKRGELRAYETPTCYKLFYANDYITTVATFEEAFAVFRREYDELKAQHESPSECVVPLALVPIATAPQSKIHQTSENCAVNPGTLLGQSHQSDHHTLHTPLSHVGGRYSKNRRRYKRKHRH